MTLLGEAILCLGRNFFPNPKLEKHHDTTMKESTKPLNMYTQLHTTKKIHKRSFILVKIYTDLHAMSHPFPIFHKKTAPIFRRTTARLNPPGVEVYLLRAQKFNSHLAWRRESVGHPVGHDEPWNLMGFNGI